MKFWTFSVRTSFQSAYCCNNWTADKCMLIVDERNKTKKLSLTGAIDKILLDLDSVIILKKVFVR
jgi:hypothetical protein